MNRGCLQRLIWPEKASHLLPLYFFAEHKKKQLPDFDLCEGGLIVGEDTQISFSALVNSFYECTWSRLATLDNLQFELEFTGCVKVEIFRNSQQCWQELVVAGVARSSDGPARFDIPLQKNAHAGRLFALITALGGSATLLGGSWRTKTQPRREVALRIVICTYNKEIFLISNLRKLLRNFANSDELREVIVVNQGSRELQEYPNYQDLCEIEGGFGKLSIIRQENFGGSGGFTRGILEALDHQDTTHVLLMDDDILFEPFVVDRVIAIHRFCHAEKKIGGQMFELENPTRMHAHNEYFDFWNLRPVTPFSGTDFTHPHAVGIFDLYHQSEYNGWWFSSFPRSTFETTGLPLPFFVRGDDIEFSYRGKKDDVHTMPGIFVWHESFRFKQSALMEYYWARNCLILTLIHSNISIKRILFMFHNSFWWFIMTFQYNLARARLLALRDFLKGPDHIFAETAEIHKRITQQLTAWAPQTVSMVNSAWKRDFLTHGRRKLRGPIWLRDLRMTYSNFFTISNLERSEKDSDMILAESRYGDPEYFYKRRVAGLFDDATGIVTIHVADRTTARSLYGQMLKELFRLWRCRDIVRQYKGRYKEFTTANYWRMYLGIER